MTQSTLSKEPVYDFNGYTHDGITGDLVFQNRPSDLKHMVFSYNPPAGAEKLLVQHWLSDGPSGGTSFTVYNSMEGNALEAPFVRDQYFMPIPYADFPFGYFYEDVIPFDPDTGLAPRRPVSRTPYLAAQDQTTVWGFLLGEANLTVLDTDSSRMDVGLSPPHWFGRFDNTESEVRLKGARGWLPWLFLNQLQDFAPHPNLPYELYRDGAVVATGDLEGAGEFPGFNTSSIVSIPATSGDYVLKVFNDLYRVNGQRGMATVTASFDTRLDDRNPPTLLSMQVLSSSGEPTARLAPTAQGRVALSFDEVLVSVPVIEYGTGDTGDPPSWRAVQVADLGSGDYLATLPSLPNDALVSLRVTARDGAGNALEYQMVPAFKVALDAPALLSPPDGYTTSGPQIPLRWGQVDTAVDYMVQVDGVDTFDSPDLYQATVTGTQHEVSLPNGIHYWRARAGDAVLNESPWSVVRSFTLADPVVQVTEGPARDSTPAMVQSSGGRVSVVWSSCPSGCSIWHAFSHDGGDTWSGDQMLSTQQFGGYEPDIASEAGGSLWVAWHSSRLMVLDGVWTWNADIFYRTSDNNGQTWSDVTRLTTHTGDDQSPSIAQTTGGRMVAVWHSNRSGNQDLWYKTSDNGGDSWSAAMPLTQDASNDIDPDIVSLEDGELWVTWNRNARVYYVTGDGGGASWSGETQLTGCCNYRPSLAQTTEGRVWVAWHSGRDDNAAHLWNEEVLYMTTDNGGADWSTETKYTQFLGADRNVGVAAVGSGDALGLVWDSPRKGDSDIWFGIIGTLEDVNPPPSVQRVTHQPYPNPDSDDVVTFKTEVVAETPVVDVDLVWSLDGVATADLRMFDDAAHGDGLAGDGMFGVRAGPLPAGTNVQYQVRVTDSGGNVVVTPRVPASFQTLEPLVTASDILLVLDRQFPPRETDYYTTALQDLGFSYDLWETYLRGPVDVPTLDQYVNGAVIWAMPDWGYLTDPAAQEYLASYLDRGGRLFLSGQRVGDFIGFSDFYREYLHAVHVESNTDIFTLKGVTGDPVGDGLSLGIDGLGGANNQYSPSEIAPVSPAVSVFTYDDPSSPGRVAALRVDTGVYRLVHFAFGFEGINSAEMRTEVMSRVLGWLVHGSITGTVDLQYRDDDSGAKVSVVGTDISTETDSNGRYLLRGVPEGEHDIEVTMPTYLTARRTGVVAVQGQVTRLPDVLLRGGDLNMDGQVDGLDLSSVAINLGRSKSDW